MKKNNFSRRSFLSVLSVSSVAMASSSVLSAPESLYGIGNPAKKMTVEPPVFKDELIVKLPRQVYGYRGSMGNLIQLKNGEIMMCYTDKGIRAVKSSNKGKTWSTSLRLVESPQQPAHGNILHPTFLRMANGDILLSYIYSTYPTTPYYGHNYYRLSSDEGKTWTDQYLMTPHSGYVIIHNDRIHTLSTGRILAIAEYKAYLPGTRDHSGYVCMSFFSDDKGYSWQPSRNTVDMFPAEVQEGDSIELKDGRIMMFARSYSGYAVRAYSYDQGETWSKGEYIKDIKSPEEGGFPSVRRIPDTGDLLFVWISEYSRDKDNPAIKRRSVLTTAISKDEGKTFIHHRNIAQDPDDDFGYQCIDFLDNGIALIGYHCRDGLRMARISIDWFYGK